MKKKKMLISVCVEAFAPHLLSNARRLGASVVRSCDSLQSHRRNGASLHPSYFGILEAPHFREPPSSPPAHLMTPPSTPPAKSITLLSTPPAYFVTPPSSSTVAKFALPMRIPPTSLSEAKALPPTTSANKGPPHMEAISSRSCTQYFDCSSTSPQLKRWCAEQPTYPFVCEAPHPFSEFRYLNHGRGFGAFGGCVFPSLGGILRKLAISCFGIPQSRHFGGRSGGLKKKKQRRQVRPVQLSLGRRMEFFHPSKHHRKTRVPMYQNARSGMVYDAHMRRWMVSWTRHGFEVFKTISVGAASRVKKKGGGGGGVTKTSFEQGRMYALGLMKGLKRMKVKKRKQFERPEVNRSGVKGVYFDADEKLWVCVWQQTGLRRFRGFSVSEMGFDEAFRAAVETRREKLRENYQFVMKRMRIKSGRDPFK